MTIKTTAFLSVALLLLLAGLLATPTTYAKGDKFKTDIGPLDGSNAHGKAKLTISRGVIRVEAKIKGLAAGHVFSVWGIVNDEDPIPAFNLTGFITDDDGKADFIGYGKVDENFPITEFVIKIKDHDTPVLGHILEQKTTKWFNCHPDPSKTCLSVAKGTFDIN